MNAPVIDHARRRREELFDFASDMAFGARVQAELAEQYAAIGDPVGLSYAARRLAAHTQALIETLHDISAKDAERA